MTILDDLREKMADRGIDVYVVPTDDFHGSEYVGDHFKCREFITGFTGSAGVAFVTEKGGGLYTDGRYFLQAESELRGSGFTLYKDREPGVPSFYETLEKACPQSGTIGFDGRVMSASAGKEIEKIAKKKGGKVDSSYDLVGLVWEDRPALSHEEAWVLPERFTGESAASKIARVRAAVKEAGADVHVLTSLTDIAWLLNIRGNDVAHCPVVLSYFLLTDRGAVLYVQEEALTDEVREALTAADVSVAPYESIYEMAGQIRGKKVLLSSGSVNDRLYRLFKAHNVIVDRENPTVKMKAVKNEKEVMNIRRAQVKDGVALTRWLYWLKQNVGSERMTEISVANKLHEFRSNMRGFLDDSFETIAGYREHGAIIHYSATLETDREIEPSGFLLVDSGGNYLEGTTDVTRTIAMGPLSNREKECFTMVLRAHLSLYDIRFRKGCSGRNFDILVREPLWEQGLDYRHGTGHGIGYLLSVHEPPNGFRYTRVPERDDDAVFEAGMVTTDEPGFYVEGHFGIRTENELLCRKWMETEYGEFLSFEPITYCPIDLDAVLPELLTEPEKAKLNRYHETVWNEISPYLEGEELEWLREATRRI